MDCCWGLNRGFASRGWPLSRLEESVLPSPPDLPAPPKRRRTGTSAQPAFFHEEEAVRGDTLVRGLCLIDAMILPQVHLDYSERQAVKQ
ncbi:hypothetical protein COCOBI_03-4650 [Coccomyxa sp. Obi]|nr:hypothetical protein COCOBI_02-4800 [Coccomyxa sp. Obi]BDA41704.1 hypothetical protein COCOBI_02-4900 [Coccomyxa sp. Obi]BDA41711.1 hypothetical protein COCOBI_02-5000 [Coccomyxa sp. Obi]BDA41717.1 hypothetical protein COCOBI_02-5090 [Coccomyxa sp. Obi]BDA41881.1 hypothetical protein COCOBI_02-6770 [Coccomyxa sp. Obi]